MKHLHRLKWPLLWGVLAAITERAAGGSHGILGGGVLVLGAALTIPWTAGAGWANAGLDLLLGPACGGLGLLAAGVGGEVAVRSALAIAAWILVLRGVLGLARMFTSELLARSMALALGAVLVAAPVLWPEATGSGGVFVSPTIWLLDFGCQLDWARAPGFYELLGDRYLGSQNDLIVWIWLGMAVVLDRISGVVCGLGCSDRRRAGLGQ